MAVRLGDGLRRRRGFLLFGISNRPFIDDTGFRLTVRLAGFFLRVVLFLVAVLVAVRFLLRRFRRGLRSKISLGIIR
jgi:hypothetical protein